MPAQAKPCDVRHVVFATRLTESEVRVLTVVAEREKISLSDLIRLKLFPQTRARKRISQQERHAVSR